MLELPDLDAVIVWTFCPTQNSRLVDRWRSQPGYQEISAPDESILRTSWPRPVGGGRVDPCHFHIDILTYHQDMKLRKQLMNELAKKLKAS